MPSRQILSAIALSHFEGSISANTTISTDAAMIRTLMLINLMALIVLPDSCRQGASSSSEMPNFSCACTTMFVCTPHLMICSAPEADHHLSRASRRRRPMSN